MVELVQARAERREKNQSAANSEKIRAGLAGDEYREACRQRAEKAAATI